MRGPTLEQAEAGAAGKRLADPFVQLLERFLDVRESMMAAGDGGFQELEREVAELADDVHAVRLLRLDALGVEGRKRGRKKQRGCRPAECRDTRAGIATA